jgi:hypothetical protein
MSRHAQTHAEKYLYTVELNVLNAGLTLQLAGTGPEMAALFNLRRPARVRVNMTVEVL